MCHFCVIEIEYINNETIDHYYYYCCLLLLSAKKSFYRYALFLSLVNITQAVGSFLWFTGKHKPISGNAGIW